MTIGDSEVNESRLDYLVEMSCDFIKNVIDLSSQYGCVCLHLFVVEAVVDFGQL